MRAIWNGTLRPRTSSRRHAYIVFAVGMMVLPCGAAWAGSCDIPRSHASQNAKIILDRTIIPCEAPDTTLNGLIPACYAPQPQAAPPAWIIDPYKTKIQLKLKSI